MERIREEIDQLKSELNWLKILWARRLPSYASRRRRHQPVRRTPEVPQEFNPTLYCGQDIT